jgi:Transposase DNA-binding
MTATIMPLPVEAVRDWVDQEMAGVELGDKRLNRRAVEVLRKLSKQPRGSIPQGCDEWADTKATYELFKNEQVTAAKLRQPHQETE